ncbi:MAG: DUF2723 domain-containing protein [Paramuribaculum sp.]|nr:DUF2723 domain-containing protein [Paramuribaculum sp.]
MKKYNIVNNALGWLCFIIAAITYLLTIEPTASFWDCPEFILQAFKLEVGHPPGNPIFMLAGRFFVNFAGGDISKVAMMVNTMSALLSAGTILLLFWTITHLVKRLIVRDDATEVSLVQQLVIFGSGICGALVYTWSDTFWFSAVEGEVYAFSSFCTALVFWLILKWENRADQPHSDKYLVLIAYVIGISIAVHLLNLLCIPAIVLVVYYRKWKNTTAKGSLIALLVSVAIVALILYGLVPGFIEIAQYFELLFVNVFGLSFNVGTIIYAILLVACYIWAISELYAQRNPGAIKFSIFLSITLSGMLFIGDSLWIAFLLTLGLAIYLFAVKRLPVRILNLVIISCLVIFTGYSSYALLLIRSSAHTPMNQNAPDNVFALSSYLNREQYGDNPLIYGATMYSQPVYRVTGESSKPIVKEGRALYAKEVKDNPNEKDHYIVTGHKKDYRMSPELNMVFPRMYSSQPEHIEGYSSWIGGLKGYPVEATIYVDGDDNALQKEWKTKPTFGENLSYFLNYQLNHMYWRYFMWNFAGRQNDIQGNGEVNHGNWISGIPFIDNPRLGDQSLLPYNEGAGNKGHNVFFMLPLILGIIGIGWQAFVSKRGIEQFWVVFFLFFMTGIAIVLYLNQTPGQPRERDYAFAGSFYAFSIWVGMGVAGLWNIFMAAIGSKDKKKNNDNRKGSNYSLAAAAVACLIGLFVPLQMVSQTWDDHDRSHRYTTRDFGENYLNSLDENAIIFTNGDNDTFPLWYAQEVEGTRTDVKVVNLSYLTTDWYVDQIRMPSYDAPGIDMLAKPKDYAYDNLQFTYFFESDSIPTPALQSLAELYSPASRQNAYGVPVLKHTNMYAPVDLQALVKAGRLTPEEAQKADSILPLNLMQDKYTANERGLTLSKVIALDMIATSAKNGWNRPVYFAMTVPERYYIGTIPYLRNTGLAYELLPLRDDSNSDEPGVNTKKMYRNVTERWKWGGLDQLKPGQEIYLDETVRRMVTTHRSAMLDLASALITEGIENNLSNLGDSLSSLNLKSEQPILTDSSLIKARIILDLMREKLPESVMPFSVQIGLQTADLYSLIGKLTGDSTAIETAQKILISEIDRYIDNILYYQSLTPVQYNSLQRTDLYIDRYYLLQLIQSLTDIGGDIDAIQQMLVDRGVDISRLGSK